jgi:hypothetical protein
MVTIPITIHVKMIELSFPPEYKAICPNYMMDGNKALEREKKHKKLLSRTIYPKQTPSPCARQVVSQFDAAMKLHILFYWNFQPSIVKFILSE